MPVLTQTCPTHGFRYVTMPRDAKEDAITDDPMDYIAKCPLIHCGHGLLRSRAQKSAQNEVHTHPLETLSDTLMRAAGLDY